MPRGYCPECDTEVQFRSEPRVGQRAICQACHSVLRVIREYPIELDWAFVEPFEKSTSADEVTPQVLES
jgi:transposase-like protein